MSDNSNKIPEGWIESDLGDLIETNKNSIGKNYQIQEINYLDTGSVTEGFFGEYQNYDLTEAPSRAKRLVQEGDIVYSTVRPNQKHYGYVENAPDNLVVSTGFTVITSKDNNSSKFIYYYLSQDRVTEYLHQVAEQSVSAYPSIKPSDIENMQVCFPFKKSEQKAIADVLSAFDQKIELLQEQNKTLENLAQTLFKEWFGKYQVGDQLPEGWKVGKLGEVTKSCGGTTPRTKISEYWDGDIYWSSPKDLSNSKGMFLLSTQRQITEKGLSKISSGLLPKGTLLLSSRAPVGYLSLTNIELAINQGYIALLEGAYLNNRFMYLWLSTFMDLIKSAANGSTFLEISKSSFRKIPCVVPEQDILKKFDNIISPIFEKILSNTLQIENLKNTRDTLLPKLMNASVRVKEFQH